MDRWLAFFALDSPDIVAVAREAAKRVAKHTPVRLKADVLALATLVVLMRQHGCAPPLKEVAQKANVDFHYLARAVRVASQILHIHHTSPQQALHVLASRFSLPPHVVSLAENLLRYRKSGTNPFTTAAAAIYAAARIYNHPLAQRQVARAAAVTCFSIRKHAHHFMSAWRRDLTRAAIRDDIPLLLRKFEEFAHAFNTPLLTRAVKLLTVAEVARILRVSERTVQRWVKRGLLPAIRINRTIRIPASALHGKTPIFLSEKELELVLNGLQALNTEEARELYERLKREQECSGSVPAS